MNYVRINKDMIFISPRGKRIVFDGYAFVFQKDDERNGYSHLCPRCHNRYRGLIRKRARSSEGCTVICGVKGCQQRLNCQTILIPTMPQIGWLMNMASVSYHSVCWMRNIYITIGKCVASATHI